MVNKYSKKEIGIVIVSIGIVLIVIAVIFIVLKEDLYKLFLGILSSMVAAGILKLLSLRFRRSRKDTFDIFLFGHSGSGKTTFIQKSITIGNSPLKSTEYFNYHSRKKFSLDLDGPCIDINIADYRGQYPEQVFDEAKKNLFINVLILFADLAPSHDDDGNELSDEEIINLMSKDWKKCLNNRLEDHNECLSKTTLQIIFGSMYGSKHFKHLKSVRFIINKFDILETLQQRGVIDNEIILKEYVEKLFKNRIMHVKRFCEENDIKDFKFEILTLKSRDKAAEMLSELGKNFYITKKIES